MTNFFSNLFATKLDGVVGIVSEIPVTLAPRCVNHNVNQEPLKPV